jgi:hypothetical protein
VRNVSVQLNFSLKSLIENMKVLFFDPKGYHQSFVIKRLHQWEIYRIIK